MELPPHLLPPAAPHHRGGAQLLDLFDDLLLLIMAQLDPLPDLFSLRRTCRRFAELGRAPELSLLVVVDDGDGRGGDGSLPLPPPPLLLPPRHRARSCHSTLAEAVAAARPGDTVRVSPTRGAGAGEPAGANNNTDNNDSNMTKQRRRDLFHEISSPVYVKSPVLIRGLGLNPEDTVLKESFSSSSSSSRAPRREEESFFEAALSFSAAAVLENLTVVVADDASDDGASSSARATTTTAAATSAAAAVHHSGGSLLVSRCCLVSYVGALSHLHAPLTTSAIGCGEGGNDDGAPSRPRNVLRVEETRVSRRRRRSGARGFCGGLGGGGGDAVRAQGSGALSSVRALPLPCGGALLWCEVDADKGGAGSAEGHHQRRSEGEGGDGVFADALPTAAEVKAAAAAAAKAPAAVASQAPASSPSLLLPLN